MHFRFFRSCRLSAKLFGPMDLIKTVAQNRLASFIAGTLILQGSVFVTATYITLSRSELAVASTLTGEMEDSDEPETVQQSSPVLFEEEPFQPKSIENEMLSRVEPEAVQDSRASIALESESLEVEEVNSPETNQIEEDLVKEESSENLQQPAKEEQPKKLKVESVEVLENIPEVVFHKVKKGDTLTKIWVSRGAPYAGGILAAKAFKSVNVSLSSLRLGEEIELQIDNDGDITALRKKLREGKTLVLEGNSKEGYEATVQKPKIVTSKRTVSAIVSNSISASAGEEGVPHAVIDELVDLFGNQVEFRRDLRVGDSFSIVYSERETDGGEKLSPGPILAASLINRGRKFVAVRHVGDNGKTHYFDAEGNPLGNFFLRYPVRFSRISSSFSKSRFHPVLKKRVPHNGVDFAAPTGTPVRTVADGVVSSAGYKGANGNMVKISHGSRYATAYVHLNRIGKGIRSGIRVKRGQVIGTVGSTGRATGPHLHYAFYDNGRYVDPMKIKLPQMPTEKANIPKATLQAVLEKLDENHRQLDVNSA